MDDLPQTRTAIRRLVAEQVLAIFSDPAEIKEHIRLIIRDILTEELPRVTDEMAPTLLKAIDRRLASTIHLDAES